MGYRIEYGPAAPRRHTGFWPLLRLQLLTAVFLLLFVLGVKKTWPEGNAKLQQLLLPGNTATASEEAVQAFLSSLQGGESFEDALTAFCQEIIAHADIQN